MFSATFSFPFISIYESICREACLPDCTTEGADGKLFMKRDNTTSFQFAKNCMTAALADYGKAEFFENSDCFRA